jgi:hypothetical protein
MIKKLLNSLLKRTNIKYRFTVPPHAEFYANGITVINDTEEIVDIWTESFPDRRKVSRDEIKDDVPRIFGQ